MSNPQAAPAPRTTIAVGESDPGMPRFKAVKAAITAALVAGEWKSGEFIPDQSRLAQRYSVSIGTLRKAIDELVAEKILIRRQGLGTFVAAHGPVRNRFHFFHIIDGDGSRQLPKPELLAFARGRADAREATELQLEPGARVIRIGNLLRLAGERVVLDTIVIGAAMFADLTEPRFRNRDSTIYSLYQTRYGINVVRTHERLRAAAADRRASKLLGLRAAAPVLEIFRVAYTYNDVPVELRHSVVDTSSRFYEADRGKVEAKR
ncbi:MAG: GntR family transcriptional regulator [Betaproteobacteria bacterium]